MAGNTYLMKFSSFVMVRYKKTVYNEVMLLIVKKRENEKRKIMFIVNSGSRVY